MDEKELCLALLRTPDSEAFRGWCWERDLADAWANYDRGDGMLWLMDQIGMDREIIRAAAMACAASGMRFAKDPSAFIIPLASAKTYLQACQLCLSIARACPCLADQMELFRDMAKSVRKVVSLEAITLALRDFSDRNSLGRYKSHEKDPTNRYAWVGAW